MLAIMRSDILNRFSQAVRYLHCPICAQPLALELASLRCPRGHCFDVARQGYVNLAPTAKQSAFYNRGSFEHRHAILERGYYRHIEQAVLESLHELSARSQFGCVLDAGCGEGHYARAVAQAFPGTAVIACDIAKDSVQLAARDDADKRVAWLVANLANLPVRDGVVDCVLDIFSPTNAQEFTRVLGERGMLLKVVPGARHDVQLREVARAQLRNTAYTNDEVFDNLSQHFTIISRHTASCTFAVPENMPYDDLLAFARMTPLLFNVDIDSLDLRSVTELTIEAEVVVAQPR